MGRPRLHPLINSVETLSPAELSVERARFDALVAGFIAHYAPAQQPQIEQDVIKSWAWDITSMRSIRPSSLSAVSIYPQSPYVGQTQNF
jgi:hypothetical protein